ncbi:MULTISPECIES: hypothetical protein [unclassified Mycobacterium]|uniref:hypothetical protein n=1 Tax=unclassified Mycobacterium TaxID=2642494 RepID=UPI0029C8E937|nr:MULTISPECIES: hypothetical protein [unclassified Mycobacterium]
MNFLQRRRMRLLIKRTQPFADAPLVAAANFTWLGNSMGAQPGVLGREDLAGGLPNWSLIAASASRLFVVESSRANPDRGVALFGSWPLSEVRLTEQNFDRKVGPVELGTYRAIRFGFPDRGPAVLQPFGREVDDLLEAHLAGSPQVAARSDGLAEVALMTTSAGPVSDDVFFVLTYRDGTTKSVPLGEDDALLNEMQELPGFDNETFIRAMAVSEEGISVLWRANAQ